MARPRKVYKYSELEIEQLLIHSDRALLNALNLLYDCQTDTEQRVEASFMNNRRGFAKPDAKSLTSLAKTWNETGSIDFDGKMYVRNKLTKRYVRQITKICNHNWETARATLI